jgi:hypothetical protein
MLHLDLAIGSPVSQPGLGEPIEWTARFASAVRVQAKLFGNHLVDGIERGARFGKLPLGAQRVRLVEHLVDLLGLVVAQGIGVDLVLHGLLGGAELLRALVIDFLFVNGVSGPTHEAGHRDADHDTSKHLSLPDYVLTDPPRRALKVCFDYGSSLRTAGWNYA